MPRVVLWMLSVVGALASADASDSIDFSFVDVARPAGLTAVTTYGGQKTNKYSSRQPLWRRRDLDYDNVAG